MHHIANTIELLQSSLAQSRQYECVIYSISLIWLTITHMLHQLNSLALMGLWHSVRNLRIVSISGFSNWDQLVYYQLLVTGGVLQMVHMYEIVQKDDRHLSIEFRCIFLRCTIKQALRMSGINWNVVRALPYTLYLVTYLHLHIYITKIIWWIWLFLYLCWI